LTDYENQLLREIQELKNRQEVVVAPAPPPPKYSDSVQNWQKGLEAVAHDIRTGSPSDGLFLKKKTFCLFVRKKGTQQVRKKRIIDRGAGTFFKYALSFDLLTCKNSIKSVVVQNKSSV